MGNIHAIAISGALIVAASISVAQEAPKPNDLQKNGRSTDLVVLLHAFNSDAGSLDHVSSVLLDEERFGAGTGFQDADVLAPDLPFGTFSMARPETVLADLLGRIDEAWDAKVKEGRPYRRIVFVGHSMGALYARKLYVLACGENPEAPLEPELKTALEKAGVNPVTEPRPWAAAVDRLVLLAGMNRGWSISHHMSLVRASLMTAGVGAGRILSVFWGRPPIIFSIRRGSPFITQLRIQWLAMTDATTVQAKGAGDALTVQLLGSVDDLVSPDDNIDLVSGNAFVYLDMPQSGHESAITMDASEAGQARAAVFAAAVSEDIDTLKRRQVLPTDTGLVRDEDVDEVVFVIHGIRDEGHWTQKIARRVIAKGRDKGLKIASETSSYGYFPMLSFLHPGARQEKVEWLMDQYTEALVRYPKATFSFVGHSNGTYLLAKALSDYPAVRFKNVVFAGSVVQKTYDWSRFMPDQVGAVLNFVATGDWVVAFFPKALQMLDIQDLGSAGHDGFDIADTNPAVHQLNHENLRYVVGGHGAALQEVAWDSIADFVLTGAFTPPPDAVLSQKQDWWVVYPSAVAPLVWVVILGVAGLLFWGLMSLNVAEWAKTLLAVAYFWLIWTIVTAV